MKENLENILQSFRNKTLKFFATTVLAIGAVYYPLEARPEIRATIRVPAYIMNSPIEFYNLDPYQYGHPVLFVGADNISYALNEIEMMPIEEMREREVRIKEEQRMSLLEREETIRERIRYFNRLSQIERERVMKLAGLEGLRDTEIWHELDARYRHGYYNHRFTEEQLISLGEMGFNLEEVEGMLRRDDRLFEDARLLKDPRLFEERIGAYRRGVIDHQESLRKGMLERRDFMKDVMRRGGK